MPNSMIVNSALIQQFLLEDYTVKSIHEKLLELGFDEDTILKHVSEFKRIKNAKRQTNGVIYLVVGSLLGFISCVLTLINPIPELQHWVLFGLTSIAVLMACYGLYLVFE